MKKITVLLITALAALPIHAQNINDGLRYSTENLNGSARFHAMSGAFGALGGDLSALNVNPAGSAVFLNSSASLSLSLYDKKNKVTYFGNKVSNYNSDVQLNQAGVVFVFNNYDEESAFKKFTIGLNYDVTNNFDNEFFAVGNSTNSIDSYFLGFAQGVPLDLLQLQSGESISDLYSFLGQTEGFGAQQAFLGYQGFILEPQDPQNPNNTTYFSNIASGNFNQEYSYLTSGYNGKYTLNVATQITDNIYVGLNLNSHLIDYRETTYFFESHDNPGTLVNQVGFRNNLAVLGNGFSAQLGGIVKIKDNWRLGLSLDTPVWYEISEETSQQLDTRRIENNENVITQVRPNVINVFADYNLRSPGKVTGSLAYIFGDKGLISFDYSYRDFSNIRFSPTDDPFFAIQNSIIENSLKGSSHFRMGGEYRWNKMSFRGGFRYDESPYEDTTQLGDLRGLSLGYGYNFGKFRIDAAYSISKQDRRQALFPGTEFTNSATINEIHNNFLLTVGFTL